MDRGSVGLEPRLVEPPSILNCQCLVMNHEEVSRLLMAFSLAQFKELMSLTELSLCTECALIHGTAITEGITEGVTGITEVSLRYH